MLRPRQLTASVSALKRWPRQTSHGSLTSGRKLIAIVRTPWPSQAWQRPACAPPVLKLKRPGPQPRALASSVSAYSRRIASQKPT